jgi:outer membrane lipoprotein-sorting protein
MMPAQSAEKAKELLQQAIQALGGDAYLSVRDVSAIGRLGQFGHSGELTGYTVFYDFSKLPDKDRIEYSSKRNIIEVFDGDRGWVMDRGGVSDASEDSVKQQQENLKVDIDLILRYRLKEPGLVFRYGGSDVVELKESDWVEITDSGQRTIRIALARSTHLPIQERVETRDPTYHTPSEDITHFSNYHPIQGVQTPFQIARERNGRKIFQAFFDDFKYNTGLADSLFTKQSLEERYDKVGNKYKDKKNKNSAP